MDNVAQRVYSGIVSLGSTAEFSVESNGGYDVELGRVVGTSVTTHQVPSTPPVSFRTFHRNATSTKEGSSIVVIPGFDLPFEPKIAMRFALSGKTWSILAITKHELADEVLAYELEVAIG